MNWTFEKVAGPFKGPTGGLAWDGKALYFSAVGEERVMRFDPKRNAVDEFRKWTFRVNGLAAGPNGEIYGGQEGGRRVLQFLPEGITTPAAMQLDGAFHNFPCDLTVDARGRVWFSDPYHAQPAVGPQMYPLLDHQSVLRLKEDHGWSLERVTFDTKAPRALALSPDEKTLYVADGDLKSKVRDLRAYPVLDNGTVGTPRVLLTFGSDARGPHRGIEGLAVDADGNLVACAGSAQSGPGPMLMVIAPSGAVLESHPAPADMPMRVAFGDEGLASLYLTAADGVLYRAKNVGRRGFARFAARQEK